MMPGRMNRGGGTARTPASGCSIKIFPTQIPLRRQKAAISAATVPPFRPETGKIPPVGGAPVATAVPSSNGANPKFTYNRLSEVPITVGVRHQEGDEKDEVV